MPDPLDFDGARRALDDVPAPDLWADASQRAEAGAVVSLPAASGERPRRPRWLVAVGVAAVAVLAVGTAAALLADDDQSVDTTPTTQPPAATGDPTTVTGGVCTVGIAGDPIVMDPGPAAEPPRFDPSGQPANQLVAHTMLGSQVAELHVPGVVLTDLVGERVEDVELERGTASIWFGPDFVQVRWFPGGQELCESFTVTVSGGSEDANRHAAVAFAERVLLPSDLGEVGVADLDGTDWQLERSTIRGEPTEGTGSAFTFADGEVTWSDGCNSFGATYTQPSPTSLDLGDVSSTERACPMNATTQAIGAVMGSDDIRVTTTGTSDELLVISSGETTLTLRPAVSDGEEPAAGSGEGYAIWPITYPGQPTGDFAFSLETPQDTALAFARMVLGWEDATITDGEPSEDGRSGALYIVRSEATGGAASVWVAAGDGADGNLVYRVDVPARSQASPQAASASIDGTTALVQVSPTPSGTSTTTVELVYGDETLGVGTVDEDITLTQAPDIPGRVLVRFLDADGGVISAWGMPLAASDGAVFSAEGTPLVG